MPYRIEARRVSFAGKAVRGAHIATFEPLNETWARDRAGVYFEGRKVSKARPESFRVLGSLLGIDERNIYYRRLAAGDVQHQRREAGLESDSLRELRSEGWLYVVSPTRVWVIDAYLMLVRGANGSRFVALGGGYSKDDERVFYVARNARPTTLEGADAVSFVFDQAGARDSRGAFVAGLRDDTPCSVEAHADPAAVARIIWNELLPRLFAHFDGTLPNDHPAFNAPQLVTDATPIPAHELAYEKRVLVVRIGAQSAQGTASSMATLAGWLWGIARHKIVGADVCVRVLPHLAPHVVANWQPLLDLAYLLAQAGEAEEAGLLVSRVLREHPHGTTLDDAPVRAQKLVPGIVAAFPPKVHALGSSTQSALTSLLPLSQDPNPIVRRDLFGEVYALIDATRKDLERLARIAEPLWASLDDAHPAVREQAASSADFLCSKLFYKQKYELALPLVELLCERGINLDLQLARRWECLASFGRDAEAEAAWEKVQALTQSYEAAPRQHGGRHFSHASYDVWRAFGELRLRRYDVVERRVAAWIRDEPAWRLGPSFRALLDELASDGGLFVNVERGDGIRIEAAGTFRELVRYRCIFEEATNTIVAKLGANFGIVFRVLGIPIGRSLSATVNVTSGARRQSYEIAVLAGLSEHFVWKFDTPEELISGLWSFEVEAFDQGVSVGEATHTFEVVVDP